MLIEVSQITLAGPVAKAGAVLTTEGGASIDLSVDDSKRALHQRSPCDRSNATMHPDERGMVARSSVAGFGTHRRSPATVTVAGLSRSPCG